MKTLRTVSALILASLLACSATALANPRIMSPQAAVETNTMVQSVQHNLVSDGYTLDAVDEEAQEYMIRPALPYVWGHLVYTYSRASHSFMLPREKVEVVVKLKYLASGISVPELSVRHLLAE